jgi:hypothetical protein
VTSLMIIFVTNRGKSARAVVTLIRLLARMDSHVNQQVAPFVKGATTPDALEKREAR